MDKDEYRGYRVLPNFSERCLLIRLLENRFLTGKVKMDDKIVNFFEVAKQTDEVLPIEYEAILKKLQSVPDDVWKEYLNVVEGYIDDLLLCKNVVAARDSHNLFRHLIAKLNHCQIEKLSRIALNLASEDPIAKVNQIIEDTFGFVPSSPETLSKAGALLNHLKALDGSYEAEAKRLATLSKDLKLLAGLFAVIKLGKEFETLLINRLSQFPIADLDRLFAMENSTIQNLK